MDTPIITPQKDDMGAALDAALKKLQLALGDNTAIVIMAARPDNYYRWRIAGPRMVIEGTVSRCSKEIPAIIWNN